MVPTLPTMQHSQHQGGNLSDYMQPQKLYAPFSTHAVQSLSTDSRSIFDQQQLNGPGAPNVCRAAETRGDMRSFDFTHFSFFNIMDFRGRLYYIIVFITIIVIFHHFVFAQKKQIIHFFRSWSPLPTPNPPLQLQFAQNTFKINVNYSNVKRNNVK